MTALQVAGALAGGAAITVGIAWAASVALGDGRITLPTNPVWAVDRKSTVHGWEIFVLTRIGVTRVIATRPIRENPAVEVTAGIVPRWSSIRSLRAISASETTPRTEAMGAFLVYEDFGYGIPFRALWHQHITAEEGRWPGSTSLVVGKEHLPIAPIWWGFVANTLVYAGALSVIVAAIGAGLGAWRSSQRRRRGLCPRCAHVVGVSSTCPECGHLIASP
jgi:hypothetical protein